MGRPVSKSNTMSTEIIQLIATIKRELKAQGLTYKDVARALKVSEASVKRVFASERFTVARLAHPRTRSPTGLRRQTAARRGLLPQSLVTRRHHQRLPDPQTRSHQTAQ